MTPTETRTDRELREFERVACEAARDAGGYLAERFRSAGVQVRRKGLNDFVTECDHEAEARVKRILSARYPDHAILAEEGSPDAGRAPYRWIVDPLDGTTNFIHGVPTFAVSIGMEDPDGLAAAAIYEPVRDELFHGRRGGGAFLNGRPVRCSKPPADNESLIATGFPFRELSRLDAYLRTFEDFVRTTAGIRRAGSAAIDLAYVACGRYDGFWEIGLSAWDVAAGTLLVREAGGVVTDVTGGDRAVTTGDIVAAGPELHGKMLEVTRRHFGGQASSAL